LFAYEYAAQLDEAVRWVVEDTEQPVSFGHRQRQDPYLSLEASVYACSEAEIVVASDSMEQVDEGAAVGFAHGNACHSHHALEDTDR
jgi:hypothetical protein